MKQYSSTIALIKNSRGIYGLDTSIGCSSGMETPGGCYGDCYAAKSAKLYGYDFSKTVLRKFTSEKHKREIVAQIDKIKLDFVRIGCSGDPSENWDHCISILNVIARSNKEIVIITKHWTLLTDQQLQYLSTINVCINTSVSALDELSQLQRNLAQYNRIKPYCKSVLRIVSCDFNTENIEGYRMHLIQQQLFANEAVIDTVFRPSKTSQYIANGIVNTKVGVFNGHKALMSKYNRKTYTGKCASCKEMCGVRVPVENSFHNKRSLTKQLTLDVSQNKTNTGKNEIHFR